MLRWAGFVAAALLFFSPLRAMPGPPRAALPAGRTAPPAALTRRADLLDINTATVEQLSALPGMGKEYARRIVAGRPYTAKNQLVSRGVLPQTAYERIAARIVARRSR